MARKQAEPAPAATPGPPAIAIGDHVRLPPEAENEYQHYRLQSRQEGRINPVQGIVLAIREIKTGEPVPVAAGDPGQYVFELLHDRTFQTGFSSDHNVGKGVPRLADNPVWVRLRSALRQKVGRGELGSQATGFMQVPPLATLLDGWRMIKVHTRAIERLEPGTEAEALPGSKS